MANNVSMDELRDLRGGTVYASDGDKIGSVDEIFYDTDTNEPEWVGIGTGFFSSKRVLVPVAGASVSGGDITVPYTKDQVKDSLDVKGDEISEETERELYSYYGLHASERSSGSQLPAGGVSERRDFDRTGDIEVAVTHGTTDTQTGLPNAQEASVTRSEEELAVGKRDVETGRIRVRKWVETEPVEANVTLRQETAHVEREPINEVVSGAEIGEDSVDVTLRGEEAVVQKQVVAKERINVDVDQTQETRTVTDEVRRERVEVEGDVDHRDDRR